MSKTKRVIVAPSGSGKITPNRIQKVVRAVHVVPVKNGGWTVKQGGKWKVAAHFSKQSDAVNYGRELSHKKQTGMFVHMKDGKIREVNSHAEDPYPPQDK